jgi:hypothetical protein
MTDRLNAYDDLASIGTITSTDGRFSLVMQGDGNLVLYRSGGKPRWATGTDGRTVSRAVMQGDGNFVIYGPADAYIWDTATDGHPGAWLTVQNDGNLVIYDPAGVPLWASHTDLGVGRVAGFLPSVSGFHFSNSYPAGTPYPVITLPVVGTIISGDAGNGLCGGFAMAALDLFLHTPRLAPPPDTSPPPVGSPIFNYIVGRLMDSFGNVGQGLQANAARVVEWITTPGHDVAVSLYGAGLGRRMAELEWPKVRADIDAGMPSPLNLVGGPERGRGDIAGIVDSLHHCHQVLAYAYELDGQDLTLLVYDCNDPLNDQSPLSLNLAHPEHTITITAPAVDANISGGIEVRGFFRSDYQAHDPSAILTPIAPPVIPVPPPEPIRCDTIRAEIQSLHDEIADLQTELHGAAPGEKAGIAAQIKGLKKQIPTLRREATALNCHP